MVDAQTFLAAALPLCTLLLAVRFAIPERKRDKRVKAKVLMRALFPSRIVRSRSGRMD